MIRWLLLWICVMFYSKELHTQTHSFCIPPPSIQTNSNSEILSLWDCMVIWWWEPVHSTQVSHINCFTVTEHPSSISQQSLGLSFGLSLSQCVFHTPPAHGLFWDYVLIYPPVTGGTEVTLRETCGKCGSHHLSSVDHCYSTAQKGWWIFFLKG